MPQAQPTRRRPTFFLLALIGLVALATSLVAQPPVDSTEPGAEGQHRIARLLPPPGYLDLTDEQIAATRDILGQLREVAEPIHLARRENRQALKELLGQDAPDATEIGELVLVGQGLRQDFHAALATADADFLALLDDEQLIKYESYKELRRFARRKGRRGPGGADEGPVAGS